MTPDDLAELEAARNAYLYSRTEDEPAARERLAQAHARAIDRERDWIENGPRPADMFCPVCGKQGFGLMRGATYQRRCRACGYEAAHKPLNTEPAALERAAAGVTSWA